MSWLDDPDDPRYKAALEAAGEMLRRCEELAELVKRRPLPPPMALDPYLQERMFPPPQARASGRSMSFGELAPEQNASTRTSQPPSEPVTAERILDAVREIARAAQAMAVAEIRLCARLTEELGVPVSSVDVSDRRIEIRCAWAPAEDLALRVLAAIEREFPGWTAIVNFLVPA